MLTLACRLREVTRGKALLLINDRVDVALACQADGVQLGEHGLPVEAARRASGDGLLLGRSVHSVEGAVAAEAEGVDVLVVGHHFRIGVPPRSVGCRSRAAQACERSRAHSGTGHRGRNLGKRLIGDRGRRVGGRRHR